MTIAGYNIRDASSIRHLKIAALRGHILEADKVNRFSITGYGLSFLLIVMNIDLQEDVVILELLQDENDELLWNCREFLRMTRNSVPRCLDIGYRVSLVVGDYLCFISPYDDILGVAYNLKQGAWHQLPQCQDGEHDKVFSFEPKLRAKGCQLRFLNSRRGGGSQHLASAINNFT